MILTTSKFEKIYADLWDLHDLLSQSDDTNAIILMCDHTWKT